MKNLFPFFALLLLFASGVRAQSAFNTTLRDQIDYSDRASDVWGYVAPDGTEYALVGLGNSLSIVSLADPDDIVEVANVPGDYSIWRDIKTYGNFAYVVADQGTSDDGILSVNLSDLPNSVSHQFYNVNNTPNGDLKKAHNIYIDTITGLAYVAGAQKSSGRLNNGGMVIYDVKTTPGVPAFVAFAPATYAHDVYVADGVMYASEILGGEMALYDVSSLADPLVTNNITRMGSIETPYEYTHNVWTTVDGNYAFTTDERGDASTAAYDISDPNDITLLDEFRPRRSLNTGVVPHNVHVTDEYLVISHYTDGIEIVDATVPDNLVEVAYYDNFTGSGGGSGVWGAYPFLPSGLILATDINFGLYVLDAEYRRAARLKGTITDRTTGNVLNNVSVTVASAEGPTTGTDALGGYKTGQVEPGTYNVTMSLDDYQTLTYPVELVNGVELIFDTTLIQLALLPVTLEMFTAENDGKTARLNWTTGTETGSDRFEVERSQDGRNFTGIGVVAAAGESTLTRSYTLVDATPFPGTNYYRLRQVDLDGNSALSNIRRVEFTGKGTLSVFPNPVGRQLTLTQAVTGEAAIYRNDGQLIRYVKLSGTSVDVEDLATGQYFLRVAGETVPFVKQ